ncbi:MAG: MraY family glycosyltransferase [Pirellulales bacterium]
MGYFIISFALSCLLALTLTPAVRQLAVRWHFVDRPDERKHHRVPVALGGGTAVFLAALTTAMATIGLAWLRGWPNLLTSERATELWGLAGAALLTTVVGVLDDTARLRVRYKVAAQFVAALLVISAGLLIERVSVLGMTVELGLLAVPFTVFWLVGAINSFNLIDGADGVASSVGVVLCLTIAVMSIAQSNPADGMVMLSLAGALLGFLCYNFPPATIYLGDAGSMLIGLVLGAMAISSSTKGAATMMLAVPVAVWAVPILDTSAAVLRRKLTGRSLFCTDRGHLHHVLLQRGWTQRSTLAFVAILAGWTCGGALLAFHFKQDWIAILTAGILVSALAATRIFGHVEMALVTGSVRKAVAKGWTRPRPGAPHQVESRVRLQGTHEWEIFWAGLTEAAVRYDLTSIQLNIHLPAMQEGYFANWNDPSADNRDMQWQLSTPLVLEGRSVGRLDVVGMATKSQSLASFSNFLHFLEHVQDNFQNMAIRLTKQKDSNYLITADPYVNEDDAQKPNQNQPVLRSP